MQSKHNELSKRIIEYFSLDRIHDDFKNYDLLYLKKEGGRRSKWMVETTPKTVKNCLY